MDGNTAFIIANLIMTALVALIQTTRFRCKCGKDKSMSMTPKDAPPSPESAVDPNSPVKASPSSPSNHVVIPVIEAPAPVVNIIPPTPRRASLQIIRPGNMV